MWGVRGVYYSVWVARVRVCVVLVRVGVYVFLFVQLFAIQLV